MRTESPPSATPTVKRVLNRLAVARRSFWARGPVVRWLAVLGIVALLGGLSSLALIPSPGKNLGEGRQYPSDDIARITHALDAAHIAYSVEDRRVGVASDRYDEATDVVSKLKLDQRSISEIRKEAQESGFWDAVGAKDQRVFEAKEEILEGIISKLNEDEIVSAYVDILREPTKTGMRPTTTTTACVFLETKRDLRAKTVQSIKKILCANIPSLKADGVTVFDRKGHQYLDPSNPALDELSRTRAREEKLAQEILEHIDWIKGAQVTVQMVAPPVSEPVEVVHPPASASIAEPRVAVNQPLEPEAEPSPRDVPAPAVAPKPPVSTDFARIWVKVPRSFYRQKALSSRDPSREELQTIHERTEATIKRAPGFLLAPGTFEITVDTIPDDEVVLRDPLIAPPVPETRRIPSWWVPAGVGAGVAATLLIVGLRLLAARRPRKAVAAEPARVRFAVEATEESGPGASERVRELIRHNPEAAASVLHRWIGHGGRAA